MAQIQARYPTNFDANGNALVATTGFPGPDLASAFNTPGVNPPYILYDLRRNNLGEALIEGLDIAVNYTTDIEGFGNLSGGVSGTINSTNTNTPAPGLAPINLVQYSVPLSAWHRVRGCHGRSGDGPGVGELQPGLQRFARP